MRKITLTLISLLFIFNLSAQVSIQNGVSNYLINFNSSFSGVNSGAFSGNGLTSNPSSGQLDAEAWAITGFSDGSHSFGQTHTSGDFARGTSSGGVSSGGLYAFNISGSNRAIGFQSTGSDWTPGTITLKVTNNSSSTVTAINASYKVYIRNDQGRGNSFNFSYSVNNSNYQGISSANLTSPSTANSSSWALNNRSVQITGLNLAAGASIYLRWSGADVNGSGSRDEFALDDISLQVTTDGGGNGGNGYYASIGSETCADLKTALHNLIDGHTQISYGALWTAYQSTDDRLNDSGNSTIVWDMYSDNPNGSENEFTFVSDQCGTYAAEGSCYNREHSFPKSWWGGSTSTTMYTDAFHVIPADGWINSVRNNNPYGEVQPGTESQITNNGSRSGSSSINIPGYSNSVFEPIDAFKGDIARIYFYMATRYEDQIAGWENFTPESDAVLDGTDFPVYEPWLVTMLTDWHNSDPVSQKELDRNDAIFAIQGNRNPFVDHPEYVDLIWGCGGNGNNGGTITLHEGYFETGWDGWQDGGGDCYRYTGSRSAEGSRSIRIRDNSGTASAMTSPVFNLSAYSSVEVTFSIYSYSMESGEDFWLRYFNGSSWSTVETYVGGTDFNNNAFKTFTVTLNSNQYNFANNAQFRFQCDASSNADQIYVDEVIITATGGASRPSTEPIVGLPAKASEVSWSPSQQIEAGQAEAHRTSFTHDQFKLYPNPASDRITIEWPTLDQEISVIEIFNFTGQRLAIRTDVSNASSIIQNVANFEKGMYIARIINQEGEQLSLRFMVR